MIYPTSTSKKLHESLGELIASKQGGERLPSEPELARQLGVSRATLREAMRTFETQGLLLRRQGSGTYVVHPFQVIESGLERLESIERLAERTGLQVSMGELKVIQRAPSSEEASALDLPAGRQVVELARVIIAEGRPAAYLIDIVPEDFLTPQELGEDFNGSVLDLFLKRGDPVLENSRCEINADTATAEAARALMIQRGDTLLKFKAFLYSRDGRIVDYSFSYFLPGYFRFHVVRRVG
jgi:GntR family transcriptional regulator